MKNRPKALRAERGWSRHRPRRGHVGVHVPDALKVVLRKSRPFNSLSDSRREWCKTGGQAAIAVGGHESRWLDGISVRIRNRAYHYRPRTEPEAGGRRRAVTSAFADFLFIRRFTRKLAVPSVIAVPTLNPARWRSA